MLALLLYTHGQLLPEKRVQLTNASVYRPILSDTPLPQPTPAKLTLTLNPNTQTMHRLQLEINILKRRQILRMQVISNVLNADRPAIVVISDVADICPRFGFGVMVIRCCLVLQVWGGADVRGQMSCI